MDKTPLDFYRRTIGRSFDLDGWPEKNRYQCWDYMAEQAHSNGVPLTVLHCSLTTYVQDIWDLRFQSGILNYYDPIPVGQFKDGDMVIWPFSYAYTPKSHVAMYWNGTAVGQSQSGQHYVCAVDYLDFNAALGGFRLKAWEDDRMKIGSWEEITAEINGVPVILSGYPDGDSLTLLSSSDPALISEIDHPDYVFDEKLNAGFFNSHTSEATYGEAYGVRCGVSEWSVPRQGKFIYYALMQDGRTEVGMDTAFWYSPEQCRCAGSPALVLMHNGQDCEYVSPSRTDRRTLSCVQSVLIRTSDRFVHMITQGNLTPDQIRDWVKENMSGVQDLVFNDGGGSVCLQRGYEVKYGTAEKRPIVNCWAAYHAKADTASAEASEPVYNPDDTQVILPISGPQEPQSEAPEEDTQPVIPVVPQQEEKEMDNETKTISGQLAKLIDVKSIITVMVMFCLCYLVVTGQEIPNDFMTVLIAIMTFYFGYQSNKGGK